MISQLNTRFFPNVPTSLTRLRFIVTDTDRCTPYPFGKLHTIMMHSVRHEQKLKSESDKRGGETKNVMRVPLDQWIVEGFVPIKGDYEPDNLVFPEKLGMKPGHTNTTWSMYGKNRFNVSINDISDAIKTRADINYKALAGLHDVSEATNRVWKTGLMYTLLHQSMKDEGDVVQQNRVSVFPRKQRREMPHCSTTDPHSLTDKHQYGSNERKRLRNSRQAQLGYILAKIS